MNAQSIIAKGMSVEDYHNELKEIAQTGKYKNEVEGSQMLDFIKLNHARTKRVLKQALIPTTLINVLKGVGSKYYWVVISEPWCGDSANVLPVISRLADLNKNIELKIILRDTHPEIMDEYLTNGTRSIPKLICFDESYKQLGVWGPRPEALQVYVDDLKMTETLSSDKLKEKIQMWYNNDKGVAICEELESIFELWFSRQEVNA